MLLGEIDVESVGAKLADGDVDLTVDDLHLGIIHGILSEVDCQDLILVVTIAEFHVVNTAHLFQDLCDVDGLWILGF